MYSVRGYHNGRTQEKGDQMKCPNCKKKMIDDEFCMYCGYLKNGYFIGKGEKRQVTELEQFLGADYDAIIHNEEQGKIFLWGPLYFAIKDRFFLGILLSLVDLVGIGLVYYILGTFLPSIVFESELIIRVVIFFICSLTVLFYNRFFWKGIIPPLYLFVVKRKMKRVKRKMTLEEYAIKRKRKYNHYKKAIIAFFVFFLLLLVVLEFVRKCIIY